MAFTGTPVVRQITDREVRITGLSLAAGAAGTIGLDQNTGSPGVRLGVQFSPAPYTGPDGNIVHLQDSIDVTAQPDALGTAVAIPIAIVKTGTKNTDFLATITNTHASTATPELEIYVHFHD